MHRIGTILNPLAKKYHKDACKKNRSKKVRTLHQLMRLVLEAFIQLDVIGRMMTKGLGGFNETK